MSELNWKRYQIVDKDRTNLSFDSEHVIFVDTTGDELLREGQDIDLSHWYPNRTPKIYRADTSTEIALNFAAANPDHDFLIVNDHSDTDGMLSVFVLACPELALQHRRIVAAAAEIGDFSFSGPREAMLLYAALREHSLGLQAVGIQGQELFGQCLAFVAEVLSGRIEHSEAVVAAVDAHERSVDMISNGRVDRRVVAARLARYIVDSQAVSDYKRLASQEPRFDQPLTGDVWLSHRSRNAFDRERLQLVSARIAGGWQHQLWLPQYVPWDTETLWRPAGWEYTGERLTWNSSALAGIVTALRSKDSSGVKWTVRETIAPWSPGFPIIAETNTPAVLDPEVVTESVASLAA